jgi:hypothetical protein
MNRGRGWRRTLAIARGVAALAELDFRRKGLAISLITILVAIAGLYLKIRQIESRPL